MIHDQCLEFTQITFFQGLTYQVITLVATHAADKTDNQLVVWLAGMRDGFKRFTGIFVCNYIFYSGISI